MFITEPNRAVTINDVTRGPFKEGKNEVSLLRTVTGWSNGYWILQHGCVAARKLDEKIIKPIFTRSKDIPANLNLTKTNLPFRWNQISKLSRTNILQAIPQDPIADTLNRPYLFMGPEYIPEDNGGTQPFEVDGYYMDREDFATFIPSQVRLAVQLGTDEYYRAVSPAGEIISMVLASKWD